MGRDVVYTFGNLHALPCVPAAFYITDHRLMSCVIRILPNPGTHVRITQSCLCCIRHLLLCFAVLNDIDYRTCYTTAPWYIFSLLQLTNLWWASQVSLLFELMILIFGKWLILFCDITACNGKWYTKINAMMRFALYIICMTSSIHYCRCLHSWPRRIRD